MIKITILIPAYNAAKTIKDTIDSVQNVINSNQFITTVYLADDCSTDDTIEIATMAWKNRKTSITVLTSERNNGEWNNVNRCLPILTVEYDWILLLHADDIANENWLDEMIDRIVPSTKKIASICSSYHVLHIDGKIDKGEEKAGINIVNGGGESIRDTLKSGTWWHVSGCALNCEYLRIYGFFLGNMRQYSDMEFLLRMLSNEYMIEYIPRPLTTYRQMNTSVSAVSFRNHTDVYEFANLIIYYHRLFSKRELINIYFKFNRQLFQRSISAIKNRNWKRLKTAIKMLYYLYGLFFITKEPSINITSYPIIND